MVMMVPAPLVRRMYIINKLKESNAFSPETAVTFEQAGIKRANWFKGVTSALLRQKKLIQCGEKYYLNR